jgi:hypothetical protein
MATKTALAATGASMNVSGVVSLGLVMHQAHDQVGEFVPASRQDFTHGFRTQPVGFTNVCVNVNVGVFHDVGSFA